MFLPEVTVALATSRSKLLLERIRGARADSRRKHLPLEPVQRADTQAGQSRLARCSCPKAWAYCSTAMSSGVSSARRWRSTTMASGRQPRARPSGRSVNRSRRVHYERCMLVDSSQLTMPAWTRRDSVRWHV